MILLAFLVLLERCLFNVNDLLMLTAAKLSPPLSRH